MNAWLVVAMSARFAHVAAFAARNSMDACPVVFRLVVPFWARMESTAWDPILLVLFGIAAALAARSVRSGEYAYRAAIVFAAVLQLIAVFIMLVCTVVWIPGCIPDPLF
jgi:hypothetical protein